MTLLAAAASALHAVPPVVRGIILMMMSTLCFSFVQTIVRWLSSDLHPFEIAFFRTLFVFPIFLPLFYRYGLSVLKTTRPGLQIVRGLLSTLSTMAFFLALSMTTLAKAAALDFSAPLFAVLGAVFFLGERIHVRRTAALTVGFLGMLVIVQPGMEGFDLGSVFAIVAALTWGAAILTIKVMARTDSSATITVYLNLIALPITFAAAIPVWQGPTAFQLLLLLIIGCLAGAGHFFFAQACRETDVSAVMPLEFLGLIWVSILGYLVFSEIPHAGIWIGGLMIFGAVAYITYREAQIAAAPQT